MLIVTDNLTKFSILILLVMRDLKFLIRIWIMQNKLLKIRIWYSCLRILKLSTGPQQ